MQDLYATLGVAKDADDDTIKRAYRTLARKHHPDRNPGDAKAEERFKEVQHAYDVLSDREKRRAYDQSRLFGGRVPPNGAGGAGGAGFGGFGDFADIFGQFFGRGGGGAGRGRDATTTRGRDVETEVRLSFEQAMKGAQVPVVLDTRTTCDTCGGSGAKPGTSPRLCPECRGRGVVGRDAGGFSIGEPCPRCSGNGTVVDDPCATCGGSGATTGRRRHTITIPPGVKDGTKIRRKGLGEAGSRGGAAGDLIVVTRVSPSRVFERQGDDLVVDVPVTFAEAALGARVEVPTPDGRVKLTVPAGSADGRSLRVPGQGAPRLKKEGRGDLIARLRVRVPQTLTDEQRAALEAFAALDSGDPREGLFP